MTNAAATNQMAIWTARESILKVLTPNVLRIKDLFRGGLVQLNRYADAFTKLGNRVFKIRDCLSLSLPEAISRVINLTAQIFRLDLTLNGYAVWLFAKEPSNLRSELRLPLIQEAYSKKLSASLDEITVGVYDFATANYESYSFTQREINKATSELGELVERLVSIARPRTLREL